MEFELSRMMFPQPSEACLTTQCLGTQLGPPTWTRYHPQAHAKLRTHSLILHSIQYRLCEILKYVILNAGFLLLYN